MDDRDSLFIKETTDVQPLRKRSGRVRVNRKVDDFRVDFSKRRDAANQQNDVSTNFLVEEGVAALDAFYILDFKRDGIQNGVYRKLKRGQYQYDAKLDLHRMTIKQARKEVLEFIEEAHKRGLRMVLMIHGKGKGDFINNHRSVLKGYVNCWLRQISVVQAFHSAINQDGGTGAVYILLKKKRNKNPSDTLNQIDFATYD